MSTSGKGNWMRAVTSLLTGDLGSLAKAMSKNLVIKSEAAR